jgi:hypothetical protein
VHLSADEELAHCTNQLRCQLAIELDMLLYVPRVIRNGPTSLEF